MLKLEDMLEHVLYKAVQDQVAEAIKNDPTFQSRISRILQEAITDESIRNMIDWIEDDENIREHIMNQVVNQIAKFEVKVNKKE